MGFSGTVSGASSPGDLPDGGSGGGSGGSGGGSGQDSDDGASNSDAYSFPAQPQTAPEDEITSTGATIAGGKNRGSEEDAVSSETVDDKGSYMNAGPGQDISPISVGWFMVFSVLLFVPYLLWAIVKAVRKSEGSSDSEVSYQNFEADQIVAKIKD